MTTVSQRPVQQRLSDWMAQQGVQPGSASKAQLEQAAKELGAPLTDVIHARSTLVEQSGARLDVAGQQSQALRDAGQGARADQGGKAIAQSPAMARFNAATPKEMEKAFAKSGYTVEDAQAAVEKFKLGSLKEGREFIGAKILSGQEGVLADKGITRSRYDAHEQMAAFKKSTYSDADVEAAIKKLPFLHNASVQETKEYMGLKVLNGAEDILAQVGITPDRYDRHEMLDAFKKSQYSNEDAVAAKAKFDFLKNDSLEGVKEYIGLKILNNYESMLSDVGITQGKYDDHEMMAAFRKSGYSDEDAVAAKKAFGFLKDSSLDEVKQYIGLKVLNKYESMLSDVGITRDNFDSHEMMAAFKKSGYSHEDAVAAKAKFDFLKNDSLDGVKEYIGLKILNGNEAMLNEVGISQSKYDDHEQMAAFKKSAYTDSDARAAQKAFDFLKGSPLDEVKQYMGLKILNKYESMLSDAGITQGKYDAHEQMDAFKQSGYTDADAKKALAAFDFLKGSPLSEVKQYIGLKVLNGNEQMLRDVGIQRPRN